MGGADNGLLTEAFGIGLPVRRIYPPITRPMLRSLPRRRRLSLFAPEDDDISQKKRRGIRSKTPVFLRLTPVFFLLSSFFLLRSSCFFFFFLSSFFLLSPCFFVLCSLFFNLSSSFFVLTSIFFVLGSLRFLLLPFSIVSRRNLPMGGSIIRKIHFLRFVSKSVVSPGLSPDNESSQTISKNTSVTCKQNRILGNRLRRARATHSTLRGGTYLRLQGHKFTHRPTTQARNKAESDPTSKEYALRRKK